MAEPFKLPPHPLRDYNPFQDEKGANPFADAPEEQAEQAEQVEQAETAGQSPDLFFSAAPATPRGHQPGDYEAILPNRRWLIFWLGVIGLAAGLIGSVAFKDMGPIVLVALSALLPGFIFGLHDLRAMKAGAMDRRGRRLTLAGIILAALGIVITVAAAAIHTYDLVQRFSNW